MWVLDCDRYVKGKLERFEVELGLYPIVSFQYSSTTLYQFSYHIQ